ncbi:hypothetical protein JCM11641_002387 [Rhodosporidiobolus odoratus]
MAPLTGRELVCKVLGKDNLSATEDSLVPEFDRFLRTNPCDSNFVLETTPGQTYGQLVCMEESCFAEILLEPHPALPDGGIQRGFGWLFKYEEHIKNSPEHVISRNTRVTNDERIKAAAPPAPIRKSGSSSKAGTSSSKGFGTSSPATSTFATSSASQDKKPAVDSMDFSPIASGSGSNGAAPPKKRKSDLMARSSAGDVFADDIVDKKPRLAPEPGVFAEVQNASAPSPVASAHTAEYKRIVDKLARWREIVRDYQDTPAAERTATDYADYDQANREIDGLVQKEATWRHIHGNPPPGQTAAIAPAVAQAAAAARPGVAHPQQVPGAYPVPAVPQPDLYPNAVAGPSDPLALARARALANDPMARAMDALSSIQLPGSGMPGMPGADGYDSDEERMWGQVGNVSNEDLDKFLQRATEGEGFEGNENVNKAAEKIGLKSQQDKLPHMNITLMPHQLIGVAWMKAQEEGHEYGGILGDEMGLGKTVEAIAAMLCTQSKDKNEKSTLIVAPVALLEQWKSEIEEKVEAGYLSVCIYHGPERHKYTAKKLRKYDVVLTSYQTLVGEYPDEEAAIKKAAKAAKADGGDMEDYLDLGKRGPLLEISWFRIILDEAQNIRNRNTQISKACCELDSIYRWALTGTPVTNSLTDLYALFRFLQIKPWYEYSHFRAHIGTYEKKSPDIAGRKAQAVLRTCMLRRKKTSKLDGQELIKLKEKNVDLREIDFSPEEREIYTMIESKAQHRFNKFLKSGTVMKNYSHVLVMLLRLRQVCIHPCLVADAEQTLAKKEEATEALKEVVSRAADEVSMDFVRKVKKQRLDLVLERINAEKAGGEAADDECPVCMESPEQNENGAIVTRCGHVFCKPCAEEFIAAPPREDHDDQGAGKKCKATQRPCPLCRQPVGLDELYNLAAFEPSDFELATATGHDEMAVDDNEDDTLGGFIVNDDEEDDAMSFGGKEKKKAPIQPNRRVIQDSDDEHSEAEEVPEPSSSSKKKGKAKEKSALELDFMQNQEPSSKMTWVLEKIQAFQATNPDEKVIIISSFTSALDLLETFLEGKGHRTTRYQGDMNRAARDESLRVLKKSKKPLDLQCKIMLLSLKAGGVGLTLTRANRIIALDLAWSPAVEQQAFDRVHRIGQTRDVFVDRLTIKETVEQRILDLQKRKQGLADAAFGEGDGHKLGKLTVADLAGLFGLNMRGQRVGAAVSELAVGDV